MATSSQWRLPNERLKDLLSAINPTDQDVRHAIEGHDSLRRFIDSIGASRTILTGSYARDTAVKPLRDVDIFCEFDPLVVTEFGSSNVELAVDYVFSALNCNRNVLGISELRRQQHSVGVSFGWTDVVVDVVPAKPYRASFQIPDRESGEWISTNPEAAIAATREANAREDGLLVPLIKLAKYWNSENNKPLKSFALEKYCLDFVIPHDHSRHRRVVLEEQIASLFAHLKKKVAGGTAPRGYTGDDHVRKTNALRLLQMAEMAAVDAVTCANSSQSRAHEKWRTIFPAY